VLAFFFGIPAEGDRSGIGQCAFSKGKRITPGVVPRLRGGGDTPPEAFGEGGGGGGGSPAWGGGAWGFGH